MNDVFSGLNSIIGGYSIKITEAPYQLNYGDECGAVLIHHQWALTTAHCGINDYVRVGSRFHSKGSKVMIILNRIHPRYGERHKFDFDVQLLKFNRFLRFSLVLKSIIISQEIGDSILVSGWGYPKEKGDYRSTLQQVEVNIVSMRKCQEVNNSWYNFTLTDTMFCAGGWGFDACQGDSGGGAVSLGKLVGLSSFGFGCGRDIPGVYTNISNPVIRKWIRLYTGV